MTSHENEEYRDGDGWPLSYGRAISQKPSKYPKDDWLFSNTILTETFGADVHSRTDKLDDPLLRTASTNVYLYIEPDWLQWDEQLAWTPCTLTAVYTLANCNAALKSYALERFLGFCLFMYLFVYRAFTSISFTVFFFTKTAVLKEWSWLL